MSVKNQISSKLAAAFSPDHIEVINESHMHSVPPDAETHFKVTLVSELFVGKRRVARHQLVYQQLQGELQGPVHALALHTYTPEEWSEAVVPDSPDCKGGSKIENEKQS